MGVSQMTGIEKRPHQPGWLEAALEQVTDRSMPRIAPRMAGADKPSFRRAKTGTALVLNCLEPGRENNLIQADKPRDAKPLNGAVGIVRKT